jgi:single-stranded DNA-binding protein
MDRNSLILSGALVAASERSVGSSGRTLTEMKLAVTRPGRKGEGEAREVVPITIWAPEVGAAMRDLPAGTPLTVLGQISAREWTAPSGQTKTFLEVVGEAVLVDATMATLGEPAAVAPAHPPVAEPVAAPARPGGPTRREPRDADKVPFLAMTTERRRVA